MITLIKNILSSHRLMPLFMAFIAMTALGAALASQYFGGLHPCILCIYQRWPYGIVIALGLIGFLLSCKYIKPVSAIMGLIGLTFIANSVIAFYHTGVEQKWWKSMFESCSVPELKGDMDQIIEDIKNRANAARCDEIPWSDPILHLSMANYNIIFCLGLGFIAFISAWMIWKKA